MDVAKTKCGCGDRVVVVQRPNGLVRKTQELNIEVDRWHLKMVEGNIERKTRKAPLFFVGGGRPPPGPGGGAGGGKQDDRGDE
jgi:hypothetical protein